MNNQFSTIRIRLISLSVASMLLLAIPGLSRAENGPAKTPANAGQHAAEKIMIQADYMKMNLNSGVSTYTGNVQIRQGSLVLTGNQVTMEQKENEVQKITVIGAPARYNHVTENGDSIVAESKKMVYIADENRLIMTGNASLQQPEHKVSSEKIVYDTLNRIVMAGDPGDSSQQYEQQRVNITLTPKPADQSQTPK
jgi:lipopolysaccharide export system protein LptA